MPIDLVCPCGNRLTVADASPGSVEKCSQCGRELTVPVPEAPPGAPSTGPVPNAAAAGRFARCVRHVWTQVFAKLGPWLAAAGRQLVNTAHYYGSNRQVLWERVKEYLGPSGFSENRHREIRLRAGDELPSLEYYEACWTVRLPDCCVVCGAAAEQDWRDEPHELSDVTAPLWAPGVGFAVGVVLAFFYWNPWWLPGAVVASLLPGYWLRRDVRVHLRVRRCDKHANYVAVPQLFAYGDRLVIRVGRGNVKTRFYEENRGLRGPPGSDRQEDTLATPIVPVRRATPTSIPLDDEPLPGDGLPDLPAPRVPPPGEPTDPEAGPKDDFSA